jgi:hypothetical protein
VIFVAALDEAAKKYLEISSKKKNLEARDAIAGGGNVER